MGGETTAPLTVNDPGRNEGIQSLFDEHSRRFAETIEIGRNVFASGQVRPVESHQSGAVGVGKDDEDLLRGDAADIGDGGDEIAVLGRAHDAVIKGDEHLAAVPFKGGEDGDGGSERPMHAGGLLVFRRPPHAVVDVGRRGDVRRRERKTAAALRHGVFGAGKDGHSARLNRFAGVASRFARAGLCHPMAQAIRSFHTSPCTSVRRTSRPA